MEISNKTKQVLTELQYESNSMINTLSNTIAETVIILVKAQRGDLDAQINTDDLVIDLANLRGYLNELKV